MYLEIYERFPSPSGVRSFFIFETLKSMNLIHSSFRPLQGYGLFYKLFAYLIGDERLISVPFRGTVFFISL